MAVEEVEKRIQECINDRITSLDLRGLGLTQIPRQIQQLTWLEKLDLSENQLEKIEGLEGLKSLRELYLYQNKLEKIEGLEGLKS